MNIPRLACLVPPRGTPPREGLACVALYPRGALGLVNGELVVLMYMGRSWACQQVDRGTPDTSTPKICIT